jgi:hypothetical protein
MRESLADRCAWSERAALVWAAMACGLAVAGLLFV